MGWNDHAPTSQEFEAIAIEAGAIEICPLHHGVTINKSSIKAEKRAYAIATNRWKAGEILDEREGIMEGIKQVIDMAAYECPACEALRDA